MSSAGKIRQYWDETLGELKKVVHPTRQEATQATLIAVTFMVFFAVVLAVLDSVLRAVVWAVL